MWHHTHQLWTSSNMIHLHSSSKCNGQTEQVTETSSLRCSDLKLMLMRLSSEIVFWTLLFRDPDLFGELPLLHHLLPLKDDFRDLPEKLK